MTATYARLEIQAFKLKIKLIAWSKLYTENNQMRAVDAD